jgi:hypothetical protein
MKRATGSLLLVAFAAWALGAGTASAGDLANGCELVSVHQVKTTVGLPHAEIVRNHTNTEGAQEDEPNEVPGVVDAECDLGLWRGAQPKGPVAAAKKARAGEAAQVGVETWAPNEGSVNEEDWIKTGWKEKTTELIKARWKLVFEGAGKAKPLNPKGEGYIGAGATVKVTGIGKGLEAAIGCWWDVKTHRIVCIFDEEDEGNPIVKHLNSLADKIVPKFLGAP